MSDVDFIKKIRVAAYWRKQLGEYEYVQHNADDLLRWYLALETRGPLNIRSTLIERTGRYPMKVMAGLGAAPHPPLEIVELWLSSHDKIRTGPYWAAFAALFLAFYLAATNLHGCQSLVDPNRLASRPPVINLPVQPGSPGPPPQSAATMPSAGPAPASVASPTATPPATSSHH